MKVPAFSCRHQWMGDVVRHGYVCGQCGLFHPEERVVTRRTSVPFVAPGSSKPKAAKP